MNPNINSEEDRSKVLAHEVGAHVRGQQGNEAAEHKAFESQDDVIFEKQ